MSDSESPTFPSNFRRSEDCELYFRAGESAPVPGRVCSATSTAFNFLDPLEPDMPSVPPDLKHPRPQPAAAATLVRPPAAVPDLRKPAADDSSAGRIVQLQEEIRLLKETVRLQTVELEKVRAAAVGAGNSELEELSAENIELRQLLESIQERLEQAHEERELAEERTVEAAVQAKGSQTAVEALQKRLNQADTKAEGGTEAPQAVRANPVPSEELEKLKAENAELRHLTEQFRQGLKEANARYEEHVRQSNEKFEAQLVAREQELGAGLEERAHLLAEREREIAQLKEEIASGAEAEEQLIAFQQELERERDQLKQDEGILMSQMRDMELQMSKERADLARQRNELQRLHRELKHELEIASRDAVMRERLAPLYRLQEELQGRRAADPATFPQPGQHAPSEPFPSEPSPSRGAAETKVVRRSGFFRKLFNREQGA